MHALLPFRRQVLQGTLTRLGRDGEVLIALEGVTARLTSATPPSDVRTMPSALEGVELGSFELGEPPKLELDVPIRCVNDMLLLLLARRGYRYSDQDPISPAVFADLKNKQLDRSDLPAYLVFRSEAAERPGFWLEMHLDRVDMTIRGLTAEDGVIRRIKLGTVVHQDFSREFVPPLGHAGHVAYVPHQGLPR